MAVKQRTVLWYLVFFGFAVNYMIRINLNITIVEMVKQRQTSATNQNGHQQQQQRQVLSECVIENSIKQYSPDVRNDSRQIILCTTSNGTNCDNRVIKLNENNMKNKANIFTIERSMLNRLNVNFTETGFDWDEYEQGLTLGSFFWLHWLTQIPGGILAKKYGTKLIFGMANLIGCWMCFVLPIVSYWDYRALIFMRVVQGLGLAWPAMHHMTAQWIPPNERSKFVTAYLGSSVGIAIFYPLFGYIISWSSWEWVFHFCGYFGTVWYIAWVFLVYDSPATHPRISREERNFIEKSLGASVQHDKAGPVPWKAILTSKPVWMNVVAQWGGIWGLFTLMTQAPTYFKIIHGWDIKMTGLLSGLPHFTRMLFAYFFSILGDYLLRTDKMSRTNVRKMATSMCCIVKGIFVFALAYSGCNSTLAVVLLTLATMVHGAVSTGPLASIVDIAPNHAGIVLGLSGMIGVLPGFISPVVVGILTLGNQTVTSWKYVFFISAGMLFVSGVLYVLLCESTLQSWNSPKDAKDKEMQLLNVYNTSVNEKSEINNEDKENENLVNNRVKE